MVLGTLKNIIDSMKLSVAPEGDTAVVTGHHEGIPFAHHHFSAITLASQDVPVFFIDGGNQQILGSPQFSIQFIRVYWTMYTSNKRVSCGVDEFFAVVQISSASGRLEYAAKTFPIRKSMLCSDETTLLRTPLGGSLLNDESGLEETKIASIASGMRWEAELLVAHTIAQKNPGCLLVLDGCLVKVDGKEQLMIKNLCDAAASANVAVAGVSKSSGMITNTGCTIGTALKSLVPVTLADKCWLYHPIVTRLPNEPGEICIVKLHPRSRHVFRADFSLHAWQRREGILDVLAQNSTDPALLGYPYGLIEADRFARVSNEEANYLRVLLHDLLRKGGSESERLLESLFTSDVHAILDSMR